MEPATPAPPVTAVIVQHPRAEEIAAYEQWLGEIAPVCKSFPGHLGLTIIRPVPGVTTTYTVLLRFDTSEHLSTWIESPERRELLERARPLLHQEEERAIHSGLDFWFTPPQPAARVPTLWKQALLTWSAIFPLVLLCSFAVGEVLSALPFELPYALRILLVTGLVVGLMVYVIMPRYTRLVQGWLYR